MGSIGSSNGGERLYIVNDSTGLNFLGDFSKILPCDSVGTPRDAAIDLGQSGARFKDLYLSGGVNFGSAGGTGTSYSNLLDDYEEGTFTPSYVGSISGTAVHTIQIGTYLKVGNLCTVWIRLSGSQNNISGSVWIAGLPFTAANRSTYGWVNATNATWTWNTNPRTVYVNNNATTIGMWDDGTGTISSGSMNAGTSGNNIEFQVSYQTQ